MAGTLGAGWKAAILPVYAGGRSQARPRVWGSVDTFFSVIIKTFKMSSFLSYRKTKYPRSLPVPTPTVFSKKGNTFLSCELPHKAVLKLANSPLGSFKEKSFRVLKPLDVSC